MEEYLACDEVRFGGDSVRDGFHTGSCVRKTERSVFHSDGATASKEDMLAAKKAVDAFKSGMEEYLACEKSSAKKDAAGAELVKVADRFNAQVKAFKAKS